MRRRRILWGGLLVCLLVPLALYAVLPVAAPVALRYLLQYRGYHQVTLQLGYPGWQTLQVPALSFHKNMAHETLEVMVQDSQIDYDLGDLFSGRVRRLAIARASVSWRGRRGNATQPCMPAPTATSGPDLGARIPLEHLAQPMPALPWRALEVAQLQVFRECATGPLREVFISGTLQQAGESAEASVLIQGQETATYRLRCTMPQRGSLEATLHAEPPMSGPIAAVQARVSQGPSGLLLAGRVETDFAQLAPFVAWLMPGNAALQHVTGTLQATWTGTAPATASVDTVWHDPATHITGTGTLTLGVLRLAGVSPQLPVLPIPVTQWDAAFAVDDATLRMQVKGTAFDAAVTLLSKLEYQFATQAGAAELHLSPLQFDAAHIPWRKVLPPGSYPVDVTGGRLSALASLTWKPDVQPLDQPPTLYTGSATITLEDLSGQYQHVRVNGLTTTLKLHTAGAGTIIMPEPARVSMAALQSGVDVTALSLSLQLGWQPPATLAWVELRDVSAALFGGRVTSVGLRFDAARPEQAFTVNVEHIDLQQLLQVEQHKGLQGTGVLDGTLPVLLTPAGVQVQDGRLEARPPGGVIRYQPTPDTAQAVASWDARGYEVLQALSNFHYNVLTIGARYEEDGTLHLTAKAAGHNPDWQQGRPIDFNLTVQENIPALLQTLQIVQGLQQSLEERFQRP